MFTAFLIKYAEIGVKGKNRYLFEDALVEQIRYALRRCEGEFSVRKEQGRIYADVISDRYDYDEVVENLKRVFGLSHICPMIQLEDEGFERLSGEIVKYMDAVYEDKHLTFKVNARRARKNYPKTSMEINCDLGEALLNAFPEMRVDVHEPEVMLNVDTSERAKQKVIDLAKAVSKYAGEIHLHVINFTDIQMYIYDKCPHDELTIIMRRYMMRIAEYLAKENGCLGLITGIL